MIAVTLDFLLTGAGAGIRKVLYDATKNEMKLQTLDEGAKSRLTGMAWHSFCHWLEYVT